MSCITISLPDEDIAFLKSFDISLEAFFARQAQNLRQNLQQALHPDVVETSGVFVLEDDPVAAYYESRRLKHG